MAYGLAPKKTKKPSNGTAEEMQ